MKRKLFLFFILILEVFMLVVYQYYSFFEKLPLFNYVHQLDEFCLNSILIPFNTMIGLKGVENGYIYSLLLINLIFIITYLLIFGLLAKINLVLKKKKIRKVVKVPYQLTPEESEKFNYKNYQKNFPWVRILLTIIPLVILATLILARFDKEFSSSHQANLIGTLDIYSNYIGKFINSIGLNKVMDNIFSNQYKIGYFDFMNLLPNNMYWLEYAVLIVGSLLIIIIWWLLLTLIYLPFKKFLAKRKAKYAKNKYIYKKELKEYKYRIKHQKEYSQKSEQFMELVEEDLNDHQQIASDHQTMSLKKNSSRPDSYYDDLGYGVKELGVGNDSEKTQDKAFIEREVRYVSDSDYDIVLENEPIIEVVEEDEIDKLNQQDQEDELFYEKYQPETVEIKPFENYDQGKSIVNEYFSSIKEESNENIDSKIDLEESKVEEPIEEVEEEQVEEVKEEQVNENLSPLEKYRLEKKKLMEERNKMIEEGTLTEDNDPLKKYRRPGVRTGKVESRVPTMKEIELERQRIKEERSRRIKEGIARKKQMLKK